MSYTIEKLRGEPILVNILHEDFRFGSKSQTNAHDEVIRILDDAPEPLFMIIDMSQVSMDFVSLMSNANTATRGVSPILHHPKIRRTIIVSNDLIIKLSVQGMDSPIFGNVSMMLFSTLDEAIDYARSEL
jgi:hypothetical protein